MKAQLHRPQESQRRGQALKGALERQQGDKRDKGLGWGWAQCLEATQQKEAEEWAGATGGTQVCFPVPQMGHAPSPVSETPDPLPSPSLPSFLSSKSQLLCQFLQKLSPDSDPINLSSALTPIIRRLTITFCLSVFWA